MRRAFSSAAALFLFAACNDTGGIHRLPEPTIQVDELKQKPAALVDILWVIDNSGSMAPHQEKLASNLDKFIKGLTASSCAGSGMADDVCDFATKKCTVSGGGCSPPDYHIGLITEDPFSTVDQGRLRRVGLCVPALGATPSSGKHNYCAGDNRHCAVDPSNADSDPANSVCDMNQSLSFITPTTPSPINAFTRLIRVGVTGSAYEVGFQTAAQALGKNWNRTASKFDPPPIENKDFLRPDASLFFIFVADDDDGSFGDITYYYRIFATLKGAGNEAMISASAITGEPIFTNDKGTMTRGGCPAPPADKIGDPGPRFIGLSMYLRGLSSEFRACDDLRLKCDAGFACQSPIPNLPGVCVPSAQCMSDADCGHYKCGANGCIPCESGTCKMHPQNMLDLLTNAGVFGSICNDYAPVLSNLGFEASALKRKFELTKNPDCVQKVPCCGADVPDKMCNIQVPVCVKVNGTPVPNDRATGWVYEATSNAVFFDSGFLPATDATVQISYKLSPGSQPLSCTTALK